MISLISIDELKSTTIINKNVDEAYLNDAVQTAQDIKLCQLIGSKFLESLLNSIAEDGSWKGKEEDYFLVKKYIVPYLKKQVISDIIVPLNYKIRNEGSVNTTSEHVNLPSKNDAIFVKEHYEAEASFYAIRMTNYIKENIGKYPLYCSQGDIKANSNAINTVIYLG